jgi:hypothetical protein
MYSSDSGRSYHRVDEVVELYLKWQETLRKGESPSDASAFKLADRLGDMLSLEVDGVDRQLELPVDWVEIAPMAGGDAENDLHDCYLATFGWNRQIQVIVYAYNYEDALESAAAWLADNHPDEFTDPHEDIDPQDYDEDDEVGLQAAYEEAEIDHTYTEYGWLYNDNFHINEYKAKIVPAMSKFLNQKWVKEPLAVLVDALEEEPYEGGRHIPSWDAVVDALFAEISVAIDINYSYAVVWDDFVGTKRLAFFKKKATAEQRVENLDSDCYAAEAELLE